MQCRWNYETMITDCDLHILYTALHKHRDQYDYYPLSVAKRDEIGLNYRFLCIAIPKAKPEYASHLAEIGVYVPPAGKPYATCLYRRDFDQIFPYL